MLEPVEYHFMQQLDTFLQHFEQSIQEDKFVRLTLSKKRTQDSTLKKVITKLVLIKKELHLSFIYRHRTKDITKNLLVDQALLEISSLIESSFSIANLFTSEADYSLEFISQQKSKLKKNKATFTSVPDRSHDKTKKRLINGNSYLSELGVLHQNGNIKKDKGDKFKQINKFIEIIDGLLRQHPTITDSTNLQVVDMGAGKGYLTFALYDYLTNTKKLPAQVKGVEVRQDLIDLCNTIAKKVNFNQLSFELGYISDYELGEVDMLIALHACDTATDDAIYKGIKANAQLIICAPCCHKQIRKQMTSSTTLQSVIDHGILKERQAEIVTDSIRASLLEAHGYKTKVFEFISSEHTGKNVMIVGQKHQARFDRQFHLDRIQQLKTEFGIEYHYLERKLGHG